MGFDVTRFQGEVDEELLCPICSEVLEDPLQAPSCEHAFCSGCINEWLSRQQTCPVDRQTITSSQLKSVPRILRSLLSKLYISCDNKPHGCTSVVKLDLLTSHLEECEFNPKRPVPCEQGCGLVVPKDELKDHNCLRELRGLIQNQSGKIAELQQELAENKYQLNEQKREIQLLKDFMRAMRISNPQMRAIADQMEQDEVVRWASSLARARVTRWGGMISTPDAMLQAVIRRALSESGCPPHIIDQLMENAHERRWPPGLSTLETRQVSCHLSLEEPPARNVMWRMGFNELPVHRDDDYLICNESGGKKCPPCGDSSDGAPPYPHQAGGQWATGIITRTYSVGQTIEVHVNVTRSHGGKLEFKLCPNDDVKSAVSQRCLDKYPLQIADRNSRRAKITAPYDEPQLISMKLRLPAGITCDQCVLQMTNHAEQFKPQNIMFRNCADIAIVADAKSSGAAGKPVAFNARPSGQNAPFPVQRQHTLFNSGRNFG